ncbi:MAG: hypothetical protein HYZ14_01105 [Bacteroidetes bacterium]|nr:hypothetical protein [Bacteroidota bacterium]
MRNWLVIVCLVFLGASSSAQMLEEGDLVVEAGIGFPNVKPFVYIPGAVAHNSFSPFEKQGHSYGQFIVKGEFMMADKIGVMAALNYGYFTGYEESEYYDWDPVTQTNVLKTYYYDIRIHKLRFTGGFNFHIIRTSRADCYLGFLAGGKKSYANAETNDPYVSGEVQTFSFPAAFRVHFGTRFFVTDAVAINMELGLGGPAISFGATYKF